MRGPVFAAVAGAVAAAAPAVAAPAGPVVQTVLTAATVQAPAPPPRVASPYRLKVVDTPANPTFRLDDPQSILRSGYGGSLIDLFPFEGGKFHLSGGSRMFGRPGRLRSVDPEPLRLLQPFRPGGPRYSRRFSPTMLIGYGRTVERGLAFGIDAGFTMGRLGLTPDRFGRLNRRRMESIDGRGRRMGTNEIARVTALYRF